MCCCAVGYGYQWGGCTIRNVFSYYRMCSLTGYGYQWGGCMIAYMWCMWLCMWLYVCNYYMVICVAVQLGTAITREVVWLHVCNIFDCICDCICGCIYVIVMWLCVAVQLGTAINEEVVWLLCDHVYV